ncbi:DUF5008 domain-containing protein [Sphingobacterium zeae]|uniref:DUF5008 domain-containing protein n=1 Tax=Sphingobacterium zeae TaxID=1776859 RepID=A0ABU0UD66_9SPHI|nr:DUF5008 domain-containing protein [Sphingobacterium zeae]MDQ1152751.1 hypothetical protein [Sphingobacterium zeae]
MMKRLKTKIGYQLGLLSCLAISSCSKDIALGTDPYAGGKGSLGIGFYKSYSEPGTAKPGELVDFYVKGIAPYLGKLNFYVNNTKMEVVSAKDSLVTIKVPDQISSGDAKIEADGQVFYGPRLGIDGNVSRDVNYGMVNGFSSMVTDILPNAGGYIVTGAFSNFENEAVDKEIFRNGIHFIDGNGKSSAAMAFGEGANGYVNSVTKMSDGKFLLSGFFNKFDKTNVFGLVRLNPNGSVDSEVVDVINTTGNPLDARDTVCTFNAGITGSVSKVFGISDNRVIAVGNFDTHYKIDYTYSSRANKRQIGTKVKHIMRMKSDGSLDSSYMINNIGANAAIFDAELIDNERVIVTGPFTSFNGQPARGIVCIKADGSIDPSFNLGGTVDRVFDVSYNAKLKKILIAGVFSGLGANGKVKGIAVMNLDGSIDDQFVLGDISTGLVTFAQMLNNGRIIAQGTFDSYNSIKRSSFLVLEKDGTLLQKYNNQSPFEGSAIKIIESTSSLGFPALLIGGSIIQYGADRVGNIFKMEIKD